MSNSAQKERAANSAPNKENVVDLDPSKAWIKNIGVGSAKKLPRKPFIVNPEKRTPVTKPIPQKKSDDMNLSTFATPKMRNACQSVFVDETIINETVESLDTSIDSRINSTVVDECPYQTCNEIDVTIINNTPNKTGDVTKNAKFVKKMTFFDDTFDFDTTNVKNVAKPKKSTKDKVMPSQIMYNHDEITAESTLIPFNTTEASTTCAMIEKASRELRNMNIASNKLSKFCYSSEIHILGYNLNFILGPKKLQEKETFKSSLALVPPYTQFMNEKNIHNWTLKSPPHQMNLESAQPTQTKTKNEFIQAVFMQEADVNRFIESGHIYFAQGKLHFRNL